MRIYEVRGTTACASDCTSSPKFYRKIRDNFLANNENTLGLGGRAHADDFQRDVVGAAPLARKFDEFIADFCW